VAVGACRPDAPPDDLPIRVEPSFAPTPPIVGPVRIVLRITDLDGAPIEDASVRVEGTMTHAGMVPVQATAEPHGEGWWVVPEFEFTMGGDWILMTRVELPDGREAMREREVHVIGRDASSGDPASAVGRPAAGTGGGGGG
jgi:hypothetical protein